MSQIHTQWSHFSRLLVTVHAPPLHGLDDLQRLNLLQQLSPHLLPPRQDHQPDHHQLQEVQKSG